MEKKEFIDLCKKGDEQALNRLYITYSGKMMKICLRYVFDRQIAQDLLHDGFIIVFTSIATLRHPDKLESWMGMIMRNISLKYLNQRNAINQISLSDVEEWQEPADTLPSDSFPSYGTLLQAIEQLPSGYRKVFKLAVLEGLSHKEIGSLLNIAPHSSSSQLFRAKEMLRKFIGGVSLIIMLLLLLVLPFGMWLSTMRGTMKESKEAELKQGVDKQEFETLIHDSIESALPPICDVRCTQLRPVADMVKYEPVCSDSVVEAELTQLKDTVNLTNNQALNRKNRQLPHATNIYNSSNRKGNWSLMLSYSGGESQTNTQYSTINGDISSGIPEEIEERAHHYVPVSFSFSLHKKLNEHWGIETGVRYTYLRTDFTTIGEFSTERVQRTNYVGIPIKGVMQIGKYGKLSVYTSAGVALDIPVKATSEATLVEKGKTVRQKLEISAPLQCSIGFGTGFQYNITPSIGIYAELNLNYYFSNGSKLNTIRKEQPLDINLPVGVRFSW